MECVKECSDMTRAQLRDREAHHIRNTQGAVNIHIPNRTHAQIYLERRDEILANLRDAYANDEEIRQQKREYYLQNFVGNVTRTWGRGIKIRTNSKFNQIRKF
jgi:hypothetical protein